jgi:glycosyltransferase involved in cell wall biosynthesis
VNGGLMGAGFLEMKKQRTTAVCIVVENLPVPLDRRVWKEACALRDAGYRVSVICPKGKGFSLGYEVIDGIEIYRHRAYEASGALGYLLEYSSALFFELVLSLRVFARTRFQILQGCNPPDTIFLVALLLKVFGVRYIFDQHDLGPELFEAKFGKSGGLLHRLVQFCEVCSYRVASVCIATNESFRELAISRGGKSADNVFVVRNCPDLKLHVRPETQTKDKFGRSILVTYVGFMGTQDGLDLLLESIEHIVKTEKRTDTYFLLVGGGTVLNELQEIIRTKDLSSHVTLTGQVSHDEVRAYLANSDIGVAPDPKNGMNEKLTMIKTFEYMAFNLPVVLFDLEEGRRVVGPAGLYATPNDPVDFANQITKLLDSEKLRQELGERGRKRIEDGLNWEKEKVSLIGAYKAALQGSETL